MKVLLTSGGTRTKIDEVRHVGNMSSGTFGNHLCKAFLLAGHEVTFLHAKGSKRPNEFRIELPIFSSDPLGNFYKCTDFVAEANKALLDAITMMVLCKGRYYPYEYADFDEYQQALTECMFSFKPDVVVLAAAVSDYAPVKADGKISSELDEMTIRLVKTPKLIRQVKDALPDCFLVGFKLLVNSTQEQLEDAMADQMLKARADMVVGNDLRDIKASNHVLTLLSTDQHYYKLGPCPGEELARQLAEAVVMDARTLRGENRHLGA